MSENEQNKIDMYEAVLSLLAENKDIISGIPSFNWAISKLRKAIDEIKREDKMISSETFNMTIQTSKIKDELIFNLVPIASALFNFAKATNNLPLKEKTRFTQSHFVRMLDKELIEKADLLILLAEKNIGKLKSYHVSNASINNVKGILSTFKSSLDSKIASLISTSALTPLTELFNESDKILSKYLDIYMENLMAENEEFYDEYLWTRDTENLDDKKALMELEEDE